MKQLIQNFRNGETSLLEVPVPNVKKGHVLVRSVRSLVSLGTERMLVEFGKANYLKKAKQQPEKVKQVLNKIKVDGVISTTNVVLSKLNEPIPLGYCNAGVVVDVGESVDEFKIGDRVISNGPHAEFVLVPKNLVAKVPDNVSFNEAVFTVIGSIALQGIRLLKPTFGETIVVTGLGLIGLLATQLLKANGCRVIGLDFDEKKINLATQWGIEAYQVSEVKNPQDLINSFTEGIGADAILITASNSSNEIISQSAQMCRKRGRIVLVGVIGLDIKRSDFYEKELSFQISCSYGPGRYDEKYESQGIDYPLPFVRWTEKRNFQSILYAISQKTLDVSPLISQIVQFKDYHKVYHDIGNSKAIASIFKYDVDADLNLKKVKVSNKKHERANGVIGIIGAGNFAKSVIIKNLSKLGANIKYIASSKGLSSTTSAQKYGALYSTTNYRDILNDDDVDAVIIATRHNSHASLVRESLEAGKHVFVEKPLAISHEELNQIIVEYDRFNLGISVGFNRRFSPFAIDAKKQLGKTNNPINILITMNAGFIPQDNWNQDLKIGGGRIVGEACHMIDLITYLTGSFVVKVVMNALGPHPKNNTDNASILLKYQNGSQGVINYFSNGSKSYQKERIEIFSERRTIIIDNFRRSKYYGFRSQGLRQKQDKGHYDQFKIFLQNLKTSGNPTIPFDQIVNTTKTSLCAIDSLVEGRWVEINRI